jgi:hypothetical protein
MRLKKIALGSTVIMLLALLVPMVFANGELPPGYSPGYWKHQLKVMFNGRGRMQEAGNMFDYEDYIADNIDTSAIEGLSGDPNEFELEDAFLAFTDTSMNNSEDAWLTIANWFNEAAGLEPYVDTD